MRVFVCACEIKSFFPHIKIQEREGVRAWDLDREKKNRKKKRKGIDERERERERECAFLYVKSVDFFYSSNGWLIKK
jgi:hypothetical protein